MDKHIELSYCCFESFKVLAKNYLDSDSHDMYPTIEKMLEENKMTPADIAESLMPKSAEDDADSCLKRLVNAVEIVKEEARLKDEEETKQKAEEEKRLEAEKEEEEEEEEEKLNTEKVMEVKEGSQENKKLKYEEERLKDEEEKKQKAEEEERLKGEKDSSLVLS